MAPLSKSHASPFKRWPGPAIFRNINFALRTPFASRCLLRGLSETRSLNNRLRRGSALSPLLPPFFIFLVLFFFFVIFSHYKFSAPDSSRPRALFGPSRHPLQAAIDAFHPRDKRAYVRGRVDVFNLNRDRDLVVEADTMVAWK